jgi:uncharacterized protein with PIN domain
MPRQLNIRSDRAAELARDLSARHGKPIALIVEEALEVYADEAAATGTPEEHAAGLNYGDAMAYAVAVGRNAPLLFKGGDFSKTDADIHPASVITG